MIYLTQWLCPQRHCSIAFVWDPQTATEKDMLEKGEAIFTAAPVRRLCGICGSKEIRVETKPTRFNTVKEAMPQMMMLQEANLLALRILQGGKN